ncbi:hypothetical protein EZV62_009043 [Acer yangbiense]|uniref:Aminotransferase-like plant mobile domain-containing protein n=1 Tax=Acer yangbiense TaxID=1000413 RepID=A0A5C7IFF6_9ROSI|nr:hypothetical protein EZV62_009043 [Acer yangbiense]
MEGLSESDVGIVEREEIMVSLSGDGEPTMRVAHFLQPTVTSIEGPVFQLPSSCFSSLPHTFEPKNWPLKLAFYGCSSAQEDWKIWVGKMASLHESTWKKAGIYEAILNSTYEIRRHTDLVLGLAEKWCSDTKSFIFSWGEATIILEDMIIFGYSVLGSSVLSPLETGELTKTEEKMEHTRKEIRRTTGRKVDYSTWKKKVMDSGSEIEHEAFLVFWLSRFVFPVSKAIVKTIFPIAIHLARGTRIALAPAVHAHSYRDLNLLKEKIVALAQLDHFEIEQDSNALAITLHSPLQLVQIWAWERFLELRPKPNLIQLGESRFAQWHKTMLRVENGSNAVWVIAQVNDYSKPISDANLYVPPQLYEADVTTRYLEWWKKSILHLQAPKDCVLLRERIFSSSKITRKKRSKTANRVNHFIGVRFSTFKMRRRRSKETSTEKKEDDSDASGSAGLLLSKTRQSDVGNKQLNDSPFPPGSPPKSNLVNANKEDNLTTKGLSISSKKHDDVGNGQLGDGEYSSGHCQNLSSSKVVNEAMETALEDAIGSETGSTSNDMERSQGVGGDGNEHESEIQELKIEDRVSRLERIFAELKAGRFGHK